MAVTLYEKKQDCCGCGACKNVCHRDAISMVADEDGFLYPEIDAQLCVECGACQKVCGYQNLPDRSRPIACYAAAAKDEAILRQSSSGGVFAVLATQCLRASGVVYGAEMISRDGEMSIQHSRVDDEESLPLLQGSKYVQSNIEYTYREAKKDLQAGRYVLYSGTPCQIAGLHSYLGKEYERLLTVDVICHGVPSKQLFQDFLASQEEKKHGKIQKFVFRVKTNGQGMVTLIRIRRASGKIVHEIKNCHRYSYMYFFENSYFFRSSCYRCPFTTQERVADITLGDYWGFHQEHPEITESVLSNSRGVSCVLVNTQRGLQYIKKCEDLMVTLETEFAKIDKHNVQLHTPSKVSEKSEVLLNRYRKEGYKSLEEYYEQNCWFDAIIQGLRSACPVGIKRVVRRTVGCIDRVVRKRN